MSPLILLILVGVGGVMMGAIGVSLILGQGRARIRAWAISILLVGLIMLGLPLVLLGRGGSGGALRNQPISVSTQVAAATAAPGAAVDANLPQERLIIRNGSLTLVVNDTRAAQRAIEQMLAEMAGEGAFVVSSSERNNVEGQLPSISLQIRVPSTRFEEVMDRLAALAVEVRHRDQTAQDVTEEYVDVQARLESLEAARQRLLQIMQEAQNTEDLLAAEQQLTQREAEIEALKGRLQYLSQSAQLSSITIELLPYILNQPVDARWRPVETAREALDDLVGSLRGFGDFIIYFGIAVLPWWLVGGVIVYGVVHLIRRRRARTEQGKPASNLPS